MGDRRAIVGLSRRDLILRHNPVPGRFQQVHNPLTNISGGFADLLLQIVRQHRCGESGQYARRTIGVRYRGEVRGDQLGWCHVSIIQFLFFIIRKCAQLLRTKSGHVTFQ